MTTTTTSVATLHGIDKFYGSSHVLKGVDLSIERGEIVSLVGRSGSGKSTILRVLAGLSTDHTGERRVAGHPAVAFQEPRLFPWRSVRQNVSYGLNTAGVTGNEALIAADATLDEVGLADKRDAWPLTLSGGQAQRAALARALVGEPELLLLDEPFGALDALTRLTMQSLLLDLWGRHGFGILLVTHDVDEAIALGDRVVVLDGGAVAETVPVDLPRPRDRGTAGFSRIRTHLLGALGVH
ncbi:sulfonate ABC transporter ATP-binding protein [Rhodococcus sp. 06-412-2C]|uniref:ABC transporter ATP-binding protein n=1 Tax=unclassified Rhodococcus (in: high G+C Gram-positive bacteria) TaxID=192944 RepID=UPI000B9A9E9D|nr:MULTISPECIES: ABC transporter ATP-binding protein [unclassified Rhodococcus (in: high G+C Gram-positive bacteria)]OZC89811.1 sulfonate ABC transporter ATP-binding protein [Rhodococcus sp. 06-412-2C]OZC93274.1 sulfonate ABC transporter ATP-binding protein [Rhodococcus sp. 06-412-2B]